MLIAETERLRIRWLAMRDAPFILELLNEPSWIRYIGDKGVKTLEDARRYLENGPLRMYDGVGFGLYMVESRREAEPMGMCGLIKRETLQDVDLGFAFLPRFWRSGYAFEAASAVMSYGRGVIGLARIIAILSQDNDRSARLLERLGFAFEGLVTFPPTNETLKLYGAGAERSGGQP
jgi:RimJ/RimL family protein N-acetyltransferase